MPPVNSSYSHEKQRSADSVLNKSISTFNRAENKPLASSHNATPTTTSEDEQPKHWTAKVIVPSIHLTDDDDDLTPREDQPRPQSPNAEQIAERNPALTPPLVTTTTAAAAATVKSPDVKKQNIGKRKRIHLTSFFAFSMQKNPVNENEKTNVCLVEVQVLNRSRIFHLSMINHSIQHQTITLI